MAIIEQGRPQASRGFTLIEMSIVLVIIGLIVGGILKGQEIVNTAREKQVVTQLNAVRTAQNTYIDRHAQIPGDDVRSSFIAGVTGNGNGNGFLGTAASDPATVITNMKTQSLDPSKEEAAYFIDLIAEQLIGNAVAPTSTAALTTAVFGIEKSSFLPNTAFPNTGLGITSGSHPGDTTRDPQSAIGMGSNWLGIWSTVYANGGGVSLRQAGHIDVALDDGLPDTGLIRGDDDKCNKAKAAGYDGAGVTATLDINTPTCVLLINMGPNTGR